MTRPRRVVSWNVASRAPVTAVRQGAYFARLEPDIVMLQEVKAASVPTLLETAGLEWLRCSLEKRPRGADEGPRPGPRLRHRRQERRHGRRHRTL